MIDTLLDNLETSGESEISPKVNHSSDVGSYDITIDSSLSVSESIYLDSLFQQTTLVDNSLVMNELPTTISEQMNVLHDISRIDEQTIGNPNFHVVEDESTSFKSAPIEGLNTSLSMNEQLSTISNSGISSIDVDNLINTPTTDCLEVSDNDLNKLLRKTDGIERSKPDRSQISFTGSCSTRHGCQGAKDCNYSYGDYEE